MRNGEIDDEPHIGAAASWDSRPLSAAHPAGGGNGPDTDDVPDIDDIETEEEE